MASFQISLSCRPFAFHFVKSMACNGQDDEIESVLDLTEIHVHNTGDLYVSSCLTGTLSKSFV